MTSQSEPAIMRDIAKRIGAINGTNGHAEYAPPSHPERMAQLMDSAVAAVNEIGDEPARRVAALRQRLQTEYDALDADLAQLIEAINRHTEIANDRVSKYIDRATAIRDDIKGIQQRLKPPASEDDRRPLHNGESH